MTEAATANFRIRRVTLSPDNIRLGQQRNCWLCPVALALRDAFGFPCSVGYATFRFGPPRYPAGKLPYHMARWIRDHDRMGDGIPIRFDLVEDDLPFPRPFKSPGMARRALRADDCNWVEPHPELSVRWHRPWERGVTCYATVEEAEDGTATIKYEFEPEAAT